MNKLLIICGPTATGKTKVGLHLAKKFNGEIISADSRQVYKHMDVITGKDLPATFNFQYPIFNLKKDGIGCYEINKVRVWGYDLVRPDEEFNVSAFRKFALKVIFDIYKRKKLPIVVGGTGLYIDSIVKPMDKIDIPKDAGYRKKIDQHGINQLYQLLLKKRPARAMGMNPSDRSNPRRLVRALEIAHLEDLGKAGSTLELKNSNSLGIKFDSMFWIGIKTKNMDTLYDRIDERVKKRIGKLLDAEIEFLKKNDYLRYVPSRTIGYQQWIDYLKGNIPRDTAIEKWRTAEHQYAKRQLTWFKKNKEIKWFYLSDKKSLTSIENEVKKWYSTK
jgi:tRNA dimethylallyltransferase